MRVGGWTGGAYGPRLETLVGASVSLHLAVVSFTGDVSAVSFSLVSTLEAVWGYSVVFLPIQGGPLLPICADRVTSQAKQKTRLPDLGLPASSPTFPATVENISSLALPMFLQLILLRKPRITTQHFSPICLEPILLLHQPLSANNRSP